MPDFEFSPAFDGLKRNPKIEGETGTPLGIGDTGLTLTVLAASDYNPRWKAKRATAGAELNRLRNANAEAERIRARAAELYADTIVIGWYYIDPEGKRHDGPLDKDGHVIPFTREACRAFLEAFDDAFEAVEATIYKTQHFRGARVEVVADNVKN